MLTDFHTVFSKIKLTFKIGGELNPYLKQISCEGELLPVRSTKTAPFLKWPMEEPNNFRTPKSAKPTPTPIYAHLPSGQPNNIPCLYEPSDLIPHRNSDASRSISYFAGSHFMAVFGFGHSSCEDLKIKKGRRKGVLDKEFIRGSSFTLLWLAT
jgi:hypothetical protein